MHNAKRKARDAKAYFFVRRSVSGRGATKLGAKFTRPAHPSGDCIISHPYGIKHRVQGEMSERLKEHDWKSCVLAKTGTEGSNPSLSAITKGKMVK